ncbi:MAG: RpiB/LacA/LacB family sugar-phosphate isomerase [Bacteroidota bacterium]
MKIGIAADHAGFELKEICKNHLVSHGFAIYDFGAHAYVATDDYPDCIAPLAEAISSGEVSRGIAVCGSGVGASIVSNKVPGVRAGLIADTYSAHQGVEHDDMNMLCLGSRVVGEALAIEIIEAFLRAEYSQEERHQRRLNKVLALEKKYLV